MTDIHTRLQELIAPYRYKIEMHSHSFPASDCSRLKPDAFIRALHTKGYDAVVLTNHFTLGADTATEEVLRAYIENYEEVRAEGEKYGITVIFGVEITCGENDHLVYGATPELMWDIVRSAPQTYEELYRMYKSSSYVFVQAHPFRDECKPVSPDMTVTVGIFFVPL